MIASVHDGDTLRCEDGTRVRLLGIDTPELAQEPFGPDARDALAAILPLGTTARLETDVQATDRYGRTLAHVYSAAGRHANLEMARSGYAVALVIPPNVRHSEHVREAAAEARREGRGLWARGGFACEPRDFRAGRC